MSHLISNCPVKKLCNINLNIDGVFERTNDCPGQLKEAEKPEFKPKTALFPETIYKVRVK